MSRVVNIHQYQGIDSNATYLLLINPERIPHIVLVDKETYYSLTYKGTEIGEASGYLMALKRAGKKVLLLELSGFDKDPISIFNSYVKADTDSVTCLFPVRDYLLPGSEARFIFELIPELYKAETIQSAQQINMDEQIIEGGEFVLNTYDQQAIYNYIGHLNKRDAEREEDISESR